MSPEHYECFVRGGITSKEALRQRLWHATNKELAPAVGTIVQTVKKGAIGYVRHLRHVFFFGAISHKFLSFVRPHHAPWCVLNFVPWQPPLATTP